MAVPPPFPDDEAVLILHPARSTETRRRMLALAIFLLCLTIIGAALYKAIDAASDTGPDVQTMSNSFPIRDTVVALHPIDLTSTNPAQLRKITAEQAEAANATIPVARFSNPAASALAVPSSDPSSFVRGLNCMTAAVYYEAANEPLDGQRAVAQVILNRLRYPAYPHSICGVVYQGAERRTGCQFSFTCDGSLARPPVPALLAHARGVALAAMGGFVYAPVGWSTHYHADYVLPYWAGTLVKSAVIGRHIFYRLSGAPAAVSLFSASYAAAEPDLSAQTIPSMLANIAAEGGSAVAVSLADRPILSRQGTIMEGKNGIGAKDGVATAAAPMSLAPGNRTLPGNRWVIAPSGQAMSDRTGADLSASGAAGNAMAPALRK